MRDNYPFGLFAVPREQVLRLHASSGTTGKPTVVGYTRGDLDLWSDLMARTLACAGARPGDHRAQRLWLRPVHRRARLPLRRRAARLHRGADVGRRHRAAGHADAGFRRPHPVRDAVLRAQHRRSRASAWASISRTAAAASAFSAPSPGASRCAATSKRTLGIKAVDVYGLSEIVGPGVASECARRAERPARLGGPFPVRGRSIPTRSQPLPIGETGELVITTLTKEALPMIRYRTRDITRLTDEPCACGRTPCAHHARSPAATTTC